jgi:hypothetical protein
LQQAQHQYHLCRALLKRLLPICLYSARRLQPHLQTTNIALLQFHLQFINNIRYFGCQGNFLFVGKLLKPEYVPLAFRHNKKLAVKSIKSIN